MLLAIGHSARDTIEMLVRRGVPMVPKPFQMGVRIEQPQETVNRIKYGSAPLEAQLGSADYNLVAKGPHDLFTFCMCAGGHIIPSVSEPGYFCTNGMSLSKRDSPFANSGLVVTVPIEHFLGTDVLGGMRLQQHYEKKAFELGGGAYRCPIQGAKDFLLLHRATTRLPACSYPRDLVLADITVRWSRRLFGPPSNTGCRCSITAGAASISKTRSWSAPSRAAARRCASCATTTHANRRACRGCTPSGKEPGTPAALSKARTTVDGLRSALRGDLQTRAAGLRCGREGETPAEPLSDGFQ